MSIELDQNKATLINDLTFKLSYNMRRQLIIRDKQPTDLLKYAEHCQRVYQRFKDLTRIITTSERYAEKHVATTATAASATSSAKKVSTRITTTRTTSSADPNSH